MTSSLTLLTAPSSKKVPMARSMGVRGYAFRVIALVIFLLTLWVLYSHLGENVAQQALLQRGNQSGKVVVEVYYEVLCPDSRYFVLKQLYPTWQRIGSIMDIQYKPYGKASHHASDGGFMFQCQHGPNECLGNMIHTCALHYISESAKLVEYINCMMGDNYDPMQAGQSCASQLDIEWSPIEACARGKEGQKMLAVVGDDTHSLRPRVTFIPTIVLNGSQDNQKMILKNLLKEVCRKYQGVKPKDCIETL